MASCFNILYKSPLWICQIYLSKKLPASCRKSIEYFIRWSLYSIPQKEEYSVITESSLIFSLMKTKFFSRYLKRDHSKHFILPPFAHFRPHKISFYFEYLWFKFSHKNKIEIVHQLSFNFRLSVLTLSVKGAKLVITIHDLIHEKFGSPAGLYDQKSRSDFYAKADGYIFVSESTRNDFSEFYPEFFRKSLPSNWYGSNYVTDHEISKKNPKQFLLLVRGVIQKFHYFS